MRVRNFLIPLCLLVLLAFAIPAIAAADNAQVNVTPTDIIVATDIAIPVATPVFDPLGSLAVMVGIRKDNPVDKADNKNLPTGSMDKQQEKKQEKNPNWWDRYNIIGFIIGNPNPVMNEPALNLTNQTKSNDLPLQTQKDRVDLQKNATNTSIYRVEINASRSERMPNQVNQSLNPQGTGDLRNAIPENRTTISEPRETDTRIRQTNNVSLQAVLRNNATIRTDRQQISNESGNKSSAS